MFGWFTQKTEMQKLIERTGYEKSIEEVAALVGQRITTIRAFRQFILEELDAAQHGNAEAKTFVRSTGIPASEYNGAMSRSWPDVDGPSTTKPGVASAAGFKEPGTPKAPEAPKVPEIRSREDIDRLFREQGGDAAEKTIYTLAKTGNLACQQYLAAEAFGMFLGYKMGFMGGEEEARAMWTKCERYLRLAAEQGDAASQFDLAGLYLDAAKTLELSASDRDLLLKSIRWYRRAAAQGREEATHRLKWFSERFPDLVRSVAAEEAAASDVPF